MNFRFLSFANVLVVGLAFVFTACGVDLIPDNRPTSVDLGDYDFSCAVDDDCVVIFNGCGGCTCATSSIARSELERFERELADVQCSDSGVQCDCIASESRCENDLCSIYFSGDPNPEPVEG